nr:uncharacterized protein LOC124813666 [Hydra vulgaris]
MGYTHYWQLKKVIEPLKWKEFLVGVHKIIATAIDQNYPIEDKSAGDVIRINGSRGEDFDDFVITSDNLVWSFCKTARRLYDPAVTAILILLKEMVGEDVKITSDGEWDEEEWKDG